MNIKQRIKALSKAYLPDNVSHRRELHAIPELAMQEQRTAAYIAKSLQQMQIPFETGLAETGLVGTIQGREGSDAVVALRADMDALPIEEKNQVPYRSGHEGIMHACGHDVHMASLLGTARILQELRQEWPGRVRLLFQPAEEKCPGGASLMIRDGALERPQPQAIFGQHVLPSLPAGKVGVRPGAYMASADELYLVVKGKGGHAATPHLNVDPVVISSHILVALQTLVSRQARPTLPSALSFGRIEGLGKTNIIPDEVRLEGTFRTFDEAWRQRALQNIKDMAVQVARGMGGDCEVHVEKGYPFLENDEALTASFTADAVEYLGKDQVVDLDMVMTAEDFAFYAQQLPACFYRLGTARAGETPDRKLHTSTFDVDESALETGAGLMAFAAIQQLSRI